MVFSIIGIGCIAFWVAWYMYYFFILPDFEDALKKREHEFRLQKDEMSAKVLEYELKVD